MAQKSMCKPKLYFVKIVPDLVLQKVYPPFLFLKTV